MPKQSKKDTEKIFWDFYSKFDMFIGEECTCTFDPHTFDVFIKQISLARQADITNLPDKRADGNKFYTPAMAVIYCREGRLVIVLEDIESTILTTNSICVIVGDTKLCFTRKK